MRLSSWVVVVTLASACSVPRPSFECLEDDWSRCGPGGACEPGTGSCSFPDASCTSGRRFSELARLPHSDACVPLETEPARGQLCTTATSCTENRQCLGGRCLSVESFSATTEFFCAKCANQDASGRLDPGPAVCWGPSTILSPQRLTFLDFNTYACSVDPPFNCPSDCMGCTNCPSYCLGTTLLDSVSVGDSYFCYDNGKTFCAGNNDTHQTMFPTAGPVGISELPLHYTLIATGSNHTCGRTAETPGVVDCWGSTTSGQLGISESPQPGSTPAPVSSSPFPPSPNIASVDELVVGGEFTCAASNDDRLRCWGAPPGMNGFIDLGPGPLRGLGAGRDHVCALKGSRVLCWGGNDEGQAVPTDPAPWIAMPTPVMPESEFVSIATGRQHSCAITTAGEILCWGTFDRGQLGEGNVGPGPVTVRVDPPAVGPIDAGADVTCALHADDRVRCWGDVFVFEGVTYDDFEICDR